jgi:hypothetical protein
MYLQCVKSPKETPSSILKEKCDCCCISVDVMMGAKRYIVKNFGVAKLEKARDIKNYL